MSAGRPAVDIVLVDFNAGSLLGECLESIQVNAPKEAALGRVVVVDNASDPPSDVQGQRLPLPVEWIRNTANRGFAAACNQGARAGSAPYILFLNPDTRLMDGSLDVPVVFLERPENARVGIAGIQLAGADGRVSATCSEEPRAAHFLYKVLALDRIAPARFSSGLLTSWDHGTDRDVDSVMGAFYLVRRSLFEKLDGFDERFFVYFEEEDFSLRARRLGFRVRFLSAARAYHLGTGTTRAVRARRLFFSWRSRLLFGEKHFARLQVVGLFLVTYLLEPVSRLAWAAVRGKRAELREVIAAWKMLLLGRAAG